MTRKEVRREAFIAIESAMSSVIKGGWPGHPLPDGWTDADADAVIAEIGKMINRLVAGHRPTSRGYTQTP